MPETGQMYREERGEIAVVHPPLHDVRARLPDERRELYHLEGSTSGSVEGILAQIDPLVPETRCVKSTGDQAGHALLQLLGAHANERRQHRLRPAHTEASNDVQDTNGPR
jgi:hypothetical protein